MAATFPRNGSGPFLPSPIVDPAGDDDREFGGTPLRKVVCDAGMDPGAAVPALPRLHQFNYRNSDSFHQSQKELACCIVRPAVNKINGLRDQLKSAPVSRNLGTPPRPVWFLKFEKSSNPATIQGTGAMAATFPRTRGAIPNRGRFCFSGLGMSQRQAARVLGVDQKTVCNDLRNHSSESEEKFLAPANARDRRREDNQP